MREPETIEDKLFESQDMKDNRRPEVNIADSTIEKTLMVIRNQNSFASSISSSLNKEEENKETLKMSIPQLEKSEIESEDEEDIRKSHFKSFLYQ